MYIHSQIHGIFAYKPIKSTNYSYLTIFFNPVKIFDFTKNNKKCFHFRFKKKYYAKTANLLTGETAATLEEQAKAAEGIKHEIFSHWHPNITINLVNDYTPWDPGMNFT